ncbi:MAG: tRNA lysidine(34) synthetase TilS [Ignavibacterium album]|uniref:tRNA lysidine(34) synthetase TilS n=1 Tax=Ignavibacterium album TaxID=591197 RepID=UPI0026EFA2AC|nr:tRNA lysidine(34) synthetase TilS [Ignavibacterium album]MBI5661186.1 tRNA lysidine(34) synthetase TilS [Ignavibacterium album]
MKSSEQKVLQFILNHSLINSEDKILVAFSGGPDSVFLLHLLKKYQKKFKIKLAAFHLNHSLRKSADEEQKFCEKFCRNISIPFYTLNADVKTYAQQNKISVEEAGRILRYKYLQHYAKEIQFNKIATAHNADDNAETVLINLAKGTGIRGFSGIPVKRENIIRPILCLRKSEIESYLKESKIDYVIDESNLTLKYERNFIRLKIIPELEKKLNPQFVNSVLSTSLNLQNFNIFFEKLLKRIENKYVRAEHNEIHIMLSLFDKEDYFIQSELIRKILNERFSLQTEQKDVEKLLLLTKKQVGISESLKRNLKAIRERSHLVIFKEEFSYGSRIRLKAGEERKFNSHKIRISKVDQSDVKLTTDKNIEYVDGEKSGENFIIRKWKAGDKFHPIGMSGTKKISDYLNDIKTEAKEKKNQYVLTSRNKIVWVIGKRLDERFKVTPNSKIIYKLELLNE